MLVRKDEPWNVIVAVPDLPAKGLREGHSAVVQAAQAVIKIMLTGFTL